MSKSLVIELDPHGWIGI